MRNWTFALALGAMVCVGSGAYAHNFVVFNSTNTYKTRSCALVAQDLRSGNHAALKKDVYTIVRDWLEIGVGTKQVEDGLLTKEGLIPKHRALRMVISSVIWCAKNPKKDLFEASTVSYDQEIAKLKAEKSSH